MDPQLLQADRVAPAHIRYSNLTPLAFKARQRPVIFTTSNQSTYNQQNNLMRIPVSSSVAFEDGTNTFLKLTFKNTSGATLQFANSAHSLIRHLRIISSQGIDLENIRDYWYLHACMSDLLLSPENRYVRQEQGYGSHKVAAVAGDADAAAVRAGLIAVAQNQQCVNELSVANNASVTLCLPLELSASIGSAQKKLLPLFLMGELTVEIELNPYPGFRADAGAISFEVSNVELHSSLIEFDASVNMALTQMVASSGLYLHGCTWTNLYQTIAEAHNTVTTNEKLRSLKSLFFGFSPNNLGNTQRRTGRHNNFIADYQVKIGSEYLPTYSVRGKADDAKLNAEFVVELLKASSEYGNSMHTGLINCDSFAVNDNTAVSVGRAVYGCDCDAFGKENVESGISTVENSPITITWNKGAVPDGGAVSQNVYLMMYHDVIWSLSPGGALAVAK